VQKYDCGYYRSGKFCPVDEFEENKPDKGKAKIEYFKDRLKEKGPFLKEPYAKKLTRYIYELRPGIGTEEYRLLYFWHKNKAVFVHAVDRSNMTQKDIDKAEKRRKELLQYLNR